MHPSPAPAEEAPRGDLRVDPSQQWLEGIRRGDAAALEQFYRTWFDKMVAIAVSLTRRDQDFALDLVQDAMVRMIDRTPPLQTEAQLAVWVRRTLLSCAIDRIRRESRRSAREHVVGAQARDAHADPRANISSQEELAWLQSRLAELPPKDRDLLHLRLGHGATLKASGDHAGMTQGAVHGKVRRLVSSLQHHAREMFR